MDTPVFAREEATEYFFFLSLLQSASLELMVLGTRLGYNQSLVGWEYRGELKGAGKGPAMGPACV